MDTAMNSGDDGGYALADPKALQVLITRELPPALMEPLRAAYTLHEVFDRDERLAYLADHGSELPAVITSGMVGLTAAEMALMPNLKIVQTFAVGYETVDVEAAKARGVMVSNCAGNNDFSVAEHAIGLMIAITRNFKQGDLDARVMHWEAAAVDRPSMTGKKLGILGLGHIGIELAKRARAFDMQIGYHNRKPRLDSEDRYFDGLLEMATWADYLVACCPGGDATFHIVDGPVFAALGPDGFAVNVARGTVFDPDALAIALQDEIIAGAAIDVVEDEGAVPEGLLNAANLFMTPHNAGRAPETQARKVHLMRANIENYLTGKPILTPVPEMNE